MRFFLAYDPQNCYNRVKDFEYYVSRPIKERPVQNYIDLTSYPVKDHLKTLLLDRSTKKNVIWATDAYADRGAIFSDTSRIEYRAFYEFGVVLKPRILKSLEEQQARTRKNAEVYTPSWLCNKMNNYCDEQWFGRPDVFNHENDDNTWSTNRDKIEFPKKRGPFQNGRRGKMWQIYVDSKRMEITCGEAPYLVSRYDAATGEHIPVEDRIGLLDRKLRLVSENTDNEKDWIKWGERAVESCYGYEYQGDSLLIARNNVFMSYFEHFENNFGFPPTDESLKNVAKIVSYNIWQMDGKTDTVPLGSMYNVLQENPLFLHTNGKYEIDEQEEVEFHLELEQAHSNFVREKATCCIFKDWRSKKKMLTYKAWKELMGK